MWRTYTEGDTLAYSFVDTLVAMWPYYVARTIGGTFFLLGAIVGTFNIWMTVRRPSAAVEVGTDRPEDPSAASAQLKPAE